MTIEHPEGLFAIVMGIFIFIGSVYVLVALNTGWRFGYWITGASLGGLMLFLSLFWFASTLGPRGDEPRWLPMAADTDRVDQVVFENQTFTSPGQYPGGDWESVAPEDEDHPLFEEVDAMGSAIANCLSAERFPSPEEQEACDRAQELLPEADDIPRVEGMAVIVVNEVTEVAFAEEEGILVGHSTVVPLTRDPRIVEDPDEGMAIGEPFRIVAIRDPGSVRTPAVAYLVGSLLWFAFHLWGLNRAERRRISPVAA